MAALLNEMELAAGDHNGMQIDTLYIGGGTPSVLAADALADIIASAHHTFTILPGTEITIEINPGTVDLDVLHRYRASGVNRINIGVQSFQGRNLTFLGRIHTAAEAENTLVWSRKAGFENIGIDLIYGLPGQTVDKWKQDLTRAAVHVPEHLSCYTLTYEQGTPLAIDLAHGKFTPSDEKRVAQLYLTTVDFLERSGFEQYETSNFARSVAYRSRHNSKYWYFAPYLGFGPSSHSFIPPERFWNKSDLSFYCRNLERGCRPVAGRETLSREQMMIEAVYLGLRLTDGVDIAGFERRFGVKFETQFDKPLTVFAPQGMLEITKGRCRLSPRGMLLLDSIAASFIDQI
jgi:oxygen-independent coproporphyrinogen-3 oxidase